jgi:hypothetical protein
VTAAVNEKAVIHMVLRVQASSYAIVRRILDGINRLVPHWMRECLLILSKKSVIPGLHPKFITKMGQPLKSAESSG